MGQLRKALDPNRGAKFNYPIRRTTEIIAGIARVARHKNKEVLTPRHHSSTVSTFVIHESDLCTLRYTSSSVTLQPWCVIDNCALSVREEFDGTVPSMFCTIVS
jgi:hypothetical protein